MPRETPWERPKSQPDDQGMNQENDWNSSEDQAEIGWSHDDPFLVWWREKCAELDETVESIDRLTSSIDEQRQWIDAIRDARLKEEGDALANEFAGLDVDQQEAAQDSEQDVKVGESGAITCKSPARSWYAVGFITRLPHNL